MWYDKETVKSTVSLGQEGLSTFSCSHSIFSNREQEKIELDRIKGPHKLAKSRN